MARFHEKLKNDMYKAMVYQKKRLQEGGTSLENFLYCPAPPEYLSPKKGCVSVKQQYLLH